MAVELNLQAEWIDQDTIRVSWNEPTPNLTAAAFAVFVIILGFVIFAGVGSSTNSGLLGIMALAVIMITLWAVLKFVPPFSKAWPHLSTVNRSKPNAVEFSKTTTKHGDLSFPTAEITRFEYGKKSQLTGSPPQKDGRDSTLIRMWVNDSAAYDISDNNWQTQLNHEIRDALANALKAVRDAGKTDEHEAEFGKQGDFGIPDF